ncbi:MAG: (Fe-S)-binding protein [Anaerolineales bacterium]|jgi:Fe-S oxidoreductase
MTPPSNTTANASSSRQPYFYHLESASISELDKRAEKFLAAFAAILENSNYRFLIELYAKTSAKCGRCATSCQVYQASNDPHDVPCYRTNLLLDVYKQYFSGNGHWFGLAKPENSLSNEKIDEMAEFFYRCTACRRCTLDCPLGIDHGLIAHLGRYVLSEAGIAPKGLVVSVREQLEGATGNTSAIPLPALLDNIEFLQEELQDMTGKLVDFPVDQTGAEYIFFPAVSDYLMEADTLMGNAAALQAAGVSWTIGSKYFDGINYGLFYNDWVLERIIQKLVEEAHRLKAKKILIGECGHAARSARQFVPAFANGRSLPVVSILEVTHQAAMQGKLRLKKDVVTEKVTYHDPCNIARSGWIVNQPRQLLRSFVEDFVELQPHGKENYCCGGGGGLVSLDEIYDFRMQVSGKVKADQIQASGAQIVATPCANCKKQLRELVDYHKLPVQIVGVHDLVLRAIDLE